MREKLTPDQIIEAMKQGNERFRSGKMPTRCGRKVNPARSELSDLICQSGASGLAFVA
jgi:hypothetical protein